MSIGKRIVFGVPLLVIAAIAAQVVYEHKMTGVGVTGYMNQSPFTWASLSPAELNNERGYYVNWSSCSGNGVYGDGICLSASGFVPKSAVRLGQNDSVSLDIDVWMLKGSSYVSGRDCSGGVCISFVPTSAPLKGTFTPFRGPGSYYEESSGHLRSTNMLESGALITNTASGDRTRTSAIFSGIVGNVNVEPPTVGANGSITINKGQQYWKQVYETYP